MLEPIVDTILEINLIAVAYAGKPVHNPEQNPSQGCSCLVLIIQLS